MTPAQANAEYERQLRVTGELRTKLRNAEREAVNNRVVKFADLAANSLPRLRADLAAAEQRLAEIGKIKSANRALELQQTSITGSWPPKPEFWPAGEFARRFPHAPNLAPGEEDLTIPAFLLRAPAAAGARR